MALRKTNEDASVAAQLIDDASLISHVANDPDVQVAREAVSEKVQARTVAALASHYRDNDASMYAKSFVGCSNVGWDQLRFVMGSKQDPETKAPVPLALNDLDATLSKSVNAPCFKSSHTVARSRKKLSKDLGLVILEEDGSALQVQPLKNAIKSALHRKGARRAKKELNEEIVGGDAVGVFNKAKHKCTYMSLKSTGSFPYNNSPRGLYALTQWQGGDDFYYLDRQCGPLVKEMIEVMSDGGISITDSDTDSESERCFCDIEFKLSSDGAFIAAAEGACGFQGKFPCPWCMCPKNELGQEKEHPAKTHKYLCNASHLPSDLNSAHPPFPFTCPICAKRFATQDDCDDEEELVGHAAKEFRKSHDQFHKRVPVFPLEPDDIIPCTFHYLVACVKHCWTHGIGDYIKDEEMGTRISNYLCKKCGVVMDVMKVGKGSTAKACKLVSLGGEQARAVASHYELFLKAVYGLPDDYDHNNPPAGTKKFNAEQFKKTAYVGDRLVNMWNCVATQMHDRTDEPLSLNRLPGTAAEIELKAKELRIATKMYRAAYRAAFGETAFKPYTHIGKHLSEHQTRLQYDVKDYSAEAQEHQGKIMKGFTKKQNGRLSKADKNGVKGASYIQQSSEAYQVKVAAEVAHPHLVKQGYRRKQQRHKEEVQKRIEKAEKWGDDVCEASIPELGLKTEVANGKAVLAVELLLKEAEADKAAGTAV